MSCHVLNIFGREVMGGVQKCQGILCDIAVISCYLLSSFALKLDKSANKTFNLQLKVTLDLTNKTFIIRKDHHKRID